MTATLRPHDLIWLNARDALEGATESGWMASGIPACRLWCGVMLMKQGAFPWVSAG